MRAYAIPKDSKSIDEMHLVERPDPVVGPGKVLIDIKAVSLNYRDIMIVEGHYFGRKAPHELVPGSDLAGVVASVGEGVTHFKPGDRVVACFSQADPNGLATGPQIGLGFPSQMSGGYRNDGAFCERIVLHENGVLPIPEGYSFEEASCLPCAGVTAWNCLMFAGRPVRPGDTVLALGTGGVSIWALQIGVAAGARVIVTSSSDDKLARAKKLGASDGVNYKTHPDWDKEVMRLTGGRGADCVVEVGGQGTLVRSFRSLALYGKVGLIGALEGPTGDIDIHQLMFRRGTLHGIAVGDRPLFEQLNRAVVQHKIKPVIDRVFTFEQAHDALRHLRSGNFMGKVVIAR
jgi:NADPH:quinone reductase-like Zn-dependent oxidoreductase